MKALKLTIIILTIFNLFGCINIQPKPESWIYHKGGDCKSLTGIYNYPNGELSGKVVLPKRKDGVYSYDSVRNYDSVKITDNGKSLNFEFRVNGLLKETKLVTMDEINCKEGYKYSRLQFTDMFFYKGVNKSLIIKHEAGGFTALTIIPTYFKDVWWKKLDWIGSDD